MILSGSSLKKLINDSITSIVFPIEYFSSMSKHGGYSEPVAKVLVYGLTGGIILYIWRSLGLLTPGIAKITFSGAYGFLIIFWAVLFSIIMLLIGSFIIFFASFISKGNTAFEANVRIAASIGIVFPFCAASSFLFIKHMHFGTTVILLLFLYCVWMLYNALINSLEAKAGAAKSISIILSIFLFFSIIGTLTWFNAASYYSHKFREYEKIMKSVPNNDMLQNYLQKLRERQKR